MHAIAEDGNVYSWGNDKERSGILGLGTCYQQATPMINTNFQNRKILDISLSDKHGAAIDVNKLMYTWGSGTNGELGIEGVDYSNVPNQIKTTECYLVAKVQCGPSYTAFVDYNGNVFYFGRITERSQVSASFLNIKRNYKENSNLSVTDNNQSDFALLQIENITAKDFFCGVNLMAIIDLSGNLFIYNEQEKLCKVKVSKPILSLKFIYSNFYAISKDKETLYEFVQKGASFSFVNFVEKTFSVNKEFNQTISLLDLPYYSQVLFFMIECLPSKKEETEGRENKIFTLVKTKKENSEKFNTDDESNTSYYRDSLNLTNTKSDMSRMNKYSESMSKKIGNISMQYSNFEDSSVYPPNPIKSKHRELNRDYSQQSHRSSRLSCNNSRISKISDLLGKIFDRKLSQITTLNNKIINRSCEKNLIAIERLSNVAPINKKQEINKKNENTINKIIVTDKIINPSEVNSPVEIFNKNKPMEKKFFISPYSNQTEEMQRKTNFSNANDYKKIVKKLNFNNIQPQSEFIGKENKINIIKLDFSKLKNLDKTDNEIRSLSNVKFESPPLTNNSLSNVKAGFDFDSIKICTIKDNAINLNTNDHKELQLNNRITDHMELSILSNRERTHAKDSNVNSNGKSSTIKNQNVTNFCDVSHVSNGKPDVNSNTEEVSEVNSDLFNMTNKEKENENSIQNIGSESFNIQIKEIFYDDSVNIGTFAFSSEFNKINEGMIEKAQITPSCFEFNKYRRNNQNKIPKPNESKNVNADVELMNEKNVSQNYGDEVLKKINIMQTNQEFFSLNVERLNSINILDTTNGKSVENLNPDQSSEQVKILNENNMIFSFCSPSNDIPKNDDITQNISSSNITSMKTIENQLNKIETVIPLKELCSKETNGRKIPTDNMLANNLNEQLLNRTADTPVIANIQEAFNSSMLIPSQLYKRKSSISSFKTAKKDNDSGNNPNEVKRLIFANKDKYFQSKNINGIINQTDNNINRIVSSELTRNSPLDSTMSISENPKSPPKLIIKKIIEVQTRNKSISPVTNIKKDSKKDPEDSYHFINNEGDSKKITTKSSGTNLGKEISKYNLSYDKHQISIDQERNANLSEFINFKNTSVDDFKRIESPNYVSSEDLQEKSKIPDILSKNKSLSLKTILLKPSPSIKVSPKVIKVIQNIDTSKSSSYINFNQPQSFRVPMIDPIIEAEANCENSFMTAYNHTEEKLKKENNLKDKTNQNKEILIRDNMQLSKDNRLSDSNKTDKNKSFMTENRESLESSRLKENRKKDTSESNKFQLNTISSIIQNSKKNSAVVSPMSSYSIFTKLKDSNTPVNSIYLEKTGHEVSPQKKNTDSNIKSKIIEVKGIKNIKISQVTPANSNSNTKRLISNSNTNYRGSIKSKNNSKKDLNSSNDNREFLRDSNNVSCLNNTNNKTENLGALDESNIEEIELICSNNGKKLEKSNTHKILSLKIKQDVKSKNSPKQININYLKSPEGIESIGQFSKTGSSFNKRSTIEKSRKSSILSKVKSSGQQQTMNKSKRDSMKDFQTNQIDAKGKKGNETPSEIEYQAIKTPKKKSSMIDISPNSLSELNINKVGVNSLKNLNTIFAMDSNNLMQRYINSEKESQYNPSSYHKAKSVANFKLSRNQIKGSLNNEQPYDDDSTRELKISNFNYKNSENNIRYTDTLNEPDNELMTKFLKDLYESYKENENFEDYVKRIISNQEMTADKKFETSRGRQSLYKSEEVDNLKLLEDEQEIKKYLRNKFKDGNISPKLTFCLTPTKFNNDDDYKDRTNIFEPLELDKSQITQRSINLSCRKSSSLPRRTNSMDFSNSSSPKKFLIQNDTMNTIDPFLIIDDKDLRNTNRNLIKRGTFSYVSNEEQFLKLNSIRENALENESSPSKHLNDSRVVEDKSKIIQNCTQWN